MLSTRKLNTLARTRSTSAVPSYVRLSSLRVQRRVDHVERQGRLHNPHSLGVQVPKAASAEDVSLATKESASLLAPGTHTGTTLFRFVVPEYVTRFGEHLKIVGNIPELGEWSLPFAPTMTWYEGHKWVLELRIPSDIDFEFKVVAAFNNEVRWEDGLNRVIKTDVPEAEPTAVELVVNATCPFGMTQTTGLDLVLNKTTVQENCELAAATLELLEKRRTRLAQILKDRATLAQQQDDEEAKKQEAEAGRLDEAVTRQQESLKELTALLDTSRLSEDGQSLLVPMASGKVHVPSTVKMLHNVQQTSVKLALGAGSDTTSTDKPPQATTPTTAAAATAPTPAVVEKRQDPEPVVANNVAAPAAFVTNPSGHDGVVVDLGVQQGTVVSDVKLPMPAVDIGGKVEAWDPAAATATAVVAAGVSTSMESERDLGPNDPAAAIAVSAFASIQQQQKGFGTKKMKKVRKKVKKAKVTTIIQRQQEVLVFTAEDLKTTDVELPTAATADDHEEEEVQTVEMAQRDQNGAVVAVTEQPVQPVTQQQQVSFSVTETQSEMAAVVPATAGVAEDSTGDVQQQQQQVVVAGAENVVNHDISGSLTTEEAVVKAVEAAVIPRPASPDARLQQHEGEDEAEVQPQILQGGALFFSAALLASVSLPNGRKSSSPTPAPTNGHTANGNGNGHASTNGMYANSMNGNGGGAVVYDDAGDSSDEDAVELAALSRSITARLEELSGVSDARQVLDKWEDLGAEVDKAQVVQERIMSRLGGLSSCQQEEMKELQDLIQFARSKLSTKDAVPA